MFSDDNENSEKDMNYIFFNSLVSIKLVSEKNIKHTTDFYIVRMENLDQSLILKKCDTPLIQYSDLKESLFYIRNIEESLNIFGNKNNKIPSTKRQNFKEYLFNKNVKLNFNQNFLLQHMISKKFISIEKLHGNDNYILKLVSEVEKAITFPFSLKRINASYDFLTYKNIVYISIYNKEKGQNYYINHNNIDIEGFAKEERRINHYGEGKNVENNFNNYSDLCVVNNNLDKFYIINQNWYINDKEHLYNGQLVNIIFTGDKNKENDKMMLSAKGIKTENKIEEVIAIKEEVREDIDGVKSDFNQKYIQYNGFRDRIKDKVNSFSSIEVKGIPFKEDLYEHVLNNSFWVIEKKKQTKKSEESNVKPIEISDLIRIKNPLLGLYLIVKKKNRDTKYSLENSDSINLRNSALFLNNSTNANNNNNNNNILTNNDSKNNINNNINNNAYNNNNITIFPNKEIEELEFDLVTKETLEKQFFKYNFKFFHYNVSEEKKISAKGKYILKSAIINDSLENDKNINKKNRLGIQDYRTYFEPLSLNIINDNINIKIEEDCILDITKVDDRKGDEVISLQNIISDLDFILKNYKKKKASVNSVIKKITENINFFMKYLLNIDYHFKNDNFETNKPVKERQELLYRFNIVNTILEIINYFFPIVKDINSMDFSIFQKTRNNMKRKLRFRKKSLASNKRSSNNLKTYNQFLDEDSKMSSIKSMLDLILKFLLHLSKNNENIKQDIFNILTSILEFSEYIYNKDKTDLLNFIFGLLDDSESLQDFILSKKFKASKVPYNEPLDGIFYIDKILSYIETNCNFLYYYKKLIHLNKIRYREEELKEKVKMHINKVENDFRLNKYTNNYKGKIYKTIKIINNLINKQIKELDKYIDEREKEDKKIDKLSSNISDDSQDDNINININKILKIDTYNKRMNTIKSNKNSKRLNYNVDIINSNKFEEDKSNADSNEFLKERTLLDQTNKKKKTFFNISDKNSEKIIENNNDNLLETDVVINNYNIKKSDTDLIDLAKNNITILNQVLEFLDHFNKINLDKILFRKEEIFVNLIKSDIKDDILENNLNFIINGNSCYIKFINDLDFSTETTIGTILPYYIYNIFFSNDSFSIVDFKNEKDSSNINIEIMDNDDNNENISEENIDLSNKEESEEKSGEEEENENEDKYEEKKSFLDIEKENNMNNKKESIFIRENTKNNVRLNSNRHFTSYNQFYFFKKKEKNPLKEEDNKESKENLDRDITLIFDEKIIDKNEQRKRKKHKTILEKRENYEMAVSNLLKKEERKNDLIRLIEKRRDDNEKIDEYLYILYSIYIFCVNEFFEINYKILKCLINYYINYNKFCKLNFLQISLNNIKKNLMNKVVFINKKSFMNNIFDKIKVAPSLLDDNLNLLNFIDNKENFMHVMDEENIDKNYNKKLGNTSMNINKKFFENEQSVNEIKKLGKDEIILLDFLFYYCKMSDKINYLLEKIECFKKIQKFICSSKNNEIININESNKQGEELNIFDGEIKKIIKKLISNKFNILGLYGQLNVIKNKFLNLKFLSMKNDLLEDYGIIKRADFLLWLLEQYEIDIYFNKIIYLEIEENSALERNSFDKLMNIKELFEIIESEIHKAKEETDKNKKKEIIDDNENHYKIIGNKLTTLTKKVLLNIFSGKKIRQEKIIQMLLKENENFFVKIGVLNTLKIMIESIELYDLQYNIENDEKNENNYIFKLNYCKEVLRGFLEIQNTFPKFNKLITENLDIYKKLVINSLKSIKDFQGNKPLKIKEEENSFLCISYYCSEILIFLLNSTKNTFSEVYNSVIEILDLYKNIYDCFHLPKNLVTYQLFYNYLIIKVYILLSKKKGTNLDTFKYFFKSLYDLKRMKIRILTCVGHLQSYEESSNEKEDYTEEDESSDIEIKKNEENEEEEFAHWKDKLEKLYQFKIKKSLNSLEKKVSNSNENKNKAGLDIIINSENINLNTTVVFGFDNVHQKELAWETDEEKEKLMFFLYFTSIYIIYLKDKNFGLDDIEENFYDEERGKMEFNFNSWTKKINNLLDSTKNMDYIDIDELDLFKYRGIKSNASLSLKSSIYPKNKGNKTYNRFHNNEIYSTANNNTLLYNNNYLFDNDKRKKEFNLSIISKNNIPLCENRYNFELVLFESIAGYKYHNRNKIIEIPIKNMEIKEEDNSTSESQNITEKKEEEKEEKEQKEKNKNDTKIKFYYYESNNIDLLFLEKIFNDIEIKKNLRYYCTNSYTNGEYQPLASSKLMVVLFELQKRLENINIQQKKEYEILYEQFIKNEMQKFLKYLLCSFNKNDLDNINLMGNFSFSRYNEIYLYDNIFNNNESQKILPLVESLKKYEFELENIYFNELIKSNNNPSDLSILNLYKNDIILFLNSLIYLYPHYDKKICLIFFRIGFMLLYINFIKIDRNQIHKQSTKEEKKTNSIDSELNLNSIFNAIILLFSRKINHSLIETKNLFFLVMISLNAFLRKIKNNHVFVSRNKGLIQDFFNKLNFILKHLTNDFENIVNFIISAEGEQKNHKYSKIERKLNYLINFLTTLIGFKKIDKEILTKEIINFIEDIIEKIIKLIDLLLEQNNKSSFQTIELLINIIYYFVEGPDIENFKTLFNKGYYDLISHAINKIDYFNLFFNNINKENLNEILDNKIEQEYRIIKLLFIYYCLCHHEYQDCDEFIKMRYWYEENIKSIKAKLKKIYYISKKEMKNKDYETDKMLLFLKKDDFNLEMELIENEVKAKNESKINKMVKREENEEKLEFGINYKKEEKNIKIKIIENEQQKNNIEKIGDYFNNNMKIQRNNLYSDYCLIKFDLILIYYSLFNYFQESFNEEILLVPPKKSLINILMDFFISCLNFIKYIVLCLFYITYFLVKYCTKKTQSKVELLQELSDIDIKCQTLDEKEMFRFLSSKIKYIEVSLDYRLYKVYYPLLNKSRQIQENKEYYLTVDNNQLSDYVNYLLKSYDKIFLMATQHYKIRKLFDLPVFSIFFKNDNVFSLFLLILGIFTNLFIGLSYSTFTQNSCSENEYKSHFSIRVNCPHFLYNEESDHENILIYLKYFGSFMFVLQLILFTKYIIQRSAEIIALYKNFYFKEVLSGKKVYSKFKYLIGYFPSFLKMLTNFQTIYYLLSLLFILLGIFVHPFFYCFILFELVKRVELMQFILKAMYVPLKNIVTILILCIIMEYVFSVIALTIYQSHFPIISDTKNILNTFMRMFDQTFKQDGGVGTYLKITLEPGYNRFNARYYAGSRFFYDLIFFLLINMIAFQIFFMIIIDYFSQSKEKTEEFTELSESKCLVCEIEREDLEKIYSNSKDAFEMHINHSHGLIDYISYLVYLQTLNYKDPIIEERIWNLHLSNNLNYLPKKNCFKKKENEMLKEHLKK